MRSGDPHDELDAAIIGAGIGGLSAAAVLAHAGCRVAVFEAQPHPGGYLVGFARKGFSFDSSVQWLNNCRAGGYVHRVLGAIGDDYPRSIRASRVRRYRGESFDYVLTDNPDELRDQLVRDFPEDAAGIRRLFAECRKLGLHFDILNRRMRGLDTMSPPEKALFGLKMLAWVLPVWKYLNLTAEDGLARFFRHEGVKRIFCSEETFMSIIMPIAWAYSGDFQYPPSGGAQRYVDWLVEKIGENGSRVELSSPVRSVLVEGNRAVGVTLEDGTTCKARYVVAANDLVTLYERMLPPSPAVAARLALLKQADLYYSSFTVYLGLDCPAETLGLHEELACLTRGGLKREEHSSGDPSKSCLIVRCPSAIDASLAPPGKSTVTIHCAMWLEHRDRWMTGDSMARGEAYRQLKAEYADRLIGRVEAALGIDIRGHIEVMEAATPVTYWRYSGNTAGSIMGQSPTRRNIKAGLAGTCTPIRNLFLGGHWAEYGGGVPVAMKAGVNAALLILRERSKAKFKEFVGHL